MARKRIIEISVNDEYILGSGVVIGAAGADQSVILKATFNDTWVGLNIYATFRDSKGENPSVKLLLPSMEVLDESKSDQTITYSIEVPRSATEYDGKMSLVFSGFAVTEHYVYDTETDYQKLVYRDAIINTANAYFRVLPSGFSALDVKDEAEATVLEQVLEEINNLGGRVTENEGDIADLATGLAETKEEILEDIEDFLGEKTIFATKAGLKDTVAINGEVRYPSEGLEYVVNDEGTEAAVVGIGTCTDINVVVPRTYNGVPVKAVLNNAFENASIDSINLFEDVWFIGAEAFKGSPVRFIYMYAPAPFEIGADAFPDTVKGLFVPLHSVDAYKANEAWSVYADRIVAIETPESINTTIVNVCNMLSQADNNLAQVDAILLEQINNLVKVDESLSTRIGNLQAVDQNLWGLINNKCDTNVMLINHNNQQNQINGLQSQINEVNEKLGTAGVISFIPVTELPIENIVENAIYLVPAEDGAEPNLFDEFIHIDGSWEKIGSANVSVDMTDYLKKPTAPNFDAVLARRLADGSELWSQVDAGNGLALLSNGNLIVSGATKSVIDSKNTSTKPICPDTLDYAVKVGLTTNAEILTDEEKAAALEWLGVRAYVDDAIAAITDGEEVEY